MKFARMLVLCCLALFGFGAAAQTTMPPMADQKSTDITPMDQTPTFKVNVIGRTTKAINYHFRSGATKVDLRGTSLMPRAKGSAKVESHLGRIEIDLAVENMNPPQSFGSEYLTYVAWAVTPEGRAKNLGELVLDGGKKINVTTDLQAFGIIVTAEPYFAVTQPSELIVMENQVRPDTVGATEYIDARFESLAKGQYIPPRARYEPQTIDPKLPLALHEARNAVRIAQIFGADRYATDTYNKAAGLLQQAEEYQARKRPEGKPVSTVAREATQVAEDARLLSLRNIDSERLSNERKASADRESQSKAMAEDEARRRAQAESEAQESARRSKDAEAASATALEQQRAAQADSARAAKAQAEAEAARAAAMASQQQAQAEADRNRAAADAADKQRLQAEREKEELRARLLQQLNAILETRDSARGLIVNMSDVLFDSGKFTLRPGAREKLAKISGIVLAYPELKLEVEGHTDSVGGDAYNQTLSEKRAQSVSDYLEKQGIPQTNVTSRGLGKTQPVASNATPTGRQQNRRVELVVSGEVIGTKLGGANTNPSTQQPPSSKP